MEILSIVMPVYNRSALVIKMIKSIEEQSFKDWKLILIDDGSAIDEFDIICSYIKQNPKIIYIKRPDTSKKGAPACRNIGLDIASGKYIIFFDSDDLLPVFCLEERVNFMEKHPDIDFGVFPYIEYKREPNEPTNFGCTKFYKDDFIAFLKRRLPFLVVSNIYKRQSIISCGIRWDEELKSLQDADFNIQALSKGLKYDYSDTQKADYYNRVVGNGSSISKGIYSHTNFESHIYYQKKVLIAAENNRCYIQACRHSFFYLYSIMLVNYQADYAKRLIELHKDKDYIFYLILIVKDYIIRHILIPCKVPANICRWLFFPYSCIVRKLQINKHFIYSKKIIKLQK